MNHIGKQIQLTAIPEELLSRIEAIDQAVAGGGLAHPPSVKIAVFDLDNTLLDGDVGDAVFVQLKLDEQEGPLAIDKAPLPLTWLEYRDILAREGKIVAYQRITTAMAGIPLHTLIKTTRKVMDCQLPFLQWEGEKIPVPAPNPMMLQVLELLRRKGYGIYVISASNQFTVREVGRRYLSLPENHCYGIRPILEQNDDGVDILSHRLEEPLPITDGKAHVYFNHIAHDPPLITGGDSDTDIYLMNLTHPQGISIWRGDSGEKFQYIVQNINHPGCLYTTNFKNSA